MVLHLSDLGPDCCQIQDFTVLNSNNDQDNIEHTRKKKVKRNNLEPGADSSSSDLSCFVAFVRASNLHNDALYLPQDLTSSAGLKRKCREIVVRDERERSWTLDLSFNKSSDTFFISRGWRSFCDENTKKPGGMFVFKLIGNGETPLLSFCSKESINDRTQRDKNNKENCVELERKKKRLRCRDSCSPRLNRFVTITLTHSSVRKCRLGLPLSFARENGLDKPGMIILLGNDGSKWVANLRRESSGRMYLGRGLMDFIKTNGLKSGESFTLESTWENGTPMLGLFRTESTSDRRKQGERSEDSEKKSISIEPNIGNKTKNNIVEKSDSSSAIQNRFVTLTLTLEDVRDCKLILPSQFMKANGINKLGEITMLGKNGMNWFAYLLSKNGFVALGSGWKGFCEANGVKTGESFTLECIYEQDTTLIFKFCSNSEE